MGLKHTSELTVTDTVTAIKMGSGDMPVMAYAEKTGKKVNYLENDKI